MRRPILNFLPLVLGVLLDSTPDSVHQSTGVTKTLPKESFKLNPRQRSFDCLVQTKADPAAEERSCKGDTVGVKRAGGIDMILALLEGLPVACGFGDNWLEIGGTNQCRTLSSSEGLPRCNWRKRWWGLDLIHRWVRESLVRRSPQEHLNRCAQTGAWQGISARAKAWCHCCGAEFGIV